VEHVAGERAREGRGDARQRRAIGRAVAIDADRRGRAGEQRGGGLLDGARIGWLGVDARATGMPVEGGGRHPLTGAAVDAALVDEEGAGRVGGEAAGRRGHGAVPRATADATSGGRRGVHAGARPAVASGAPSGRHDRRARSSADRRAREAWR
jgi:hypothetical protein